MFLVKIKSLPKIKKKKTQTKKIVIKSKRDPYTKAPTPAKKKDDVGKKKL